MKRKKIRTKFGMRALVLLLLVISIRCDAMAATFNDINSSSMFFKQNTSTTCTLSAAAMMVRRAVMMNGNSGWSGVTESSMKSTAWSSGLKNSFTYAGITVSAAGGTSNLSAVWNKSSVDKSSLFRSLLAQHPEGIVMYCKKSNNINDKNVHAVLLTDYTNGTFYCADPSSKAASGRIPLSSATVSMNNAFKYWYVSSPKLALSAEDTEGPIIYDVKIYDVSADGYTVGCYAVDCGSGVDRVQFPSWTEKNGGDDLDPNWWPGGYSRGTQNGSYYSFRVNVSQHNWEEGDYITHIYAFDKAGNVSSTGVSLWIDRTPPVISDVKILDMDATGYTVQCTVTDNCYVSKVQFPTWTEKNGGDDLADSWWENSACTGEASGSVYTFRVRDSAHNYERGIYHTHIYAYDSYGNLQQYGLNNINFQNTYRAVKETSYNGNIYRLYDDCLTWDEAKKKCEELGGHLVTITSAEEQKIITQLVSSQARRLYWIGGRKAGSSTWVTGEDFSYTNWEPGQPDEWCGEDRYGVYSATGTWNDLPDTDRNWGFICEWEKQQTSDFGSGGGKPDTSNHHSPSVSAGAGSDQASERIYTIAFQVNGGNQLRSASKSGIVGKRYGVLPKPVRRNYNFKGWYTQPAGGSRITADSTANVKGTITLYAHWSKVKVKKTAISSLKGVAGKKAVVKFKKISGARGYEIRYSTDRRFKKNNKTVTASSNSVKLKKLSKGRTYYVKVRAYKIDSTGKKVYGEYSAVKRIRIVK